MTEQHIENSKLLELLEHVNQIGEIGVFQFDVITGEIYWNEIMREIHEVDKNFVPTKDNVFSFFSTNAKREKFEYDYLKTIENGSILEFENVITTAKGNRLIVQCTTQPTYKDNKCVNIYGTVFDITEQKLSELELLQRNKQLNFAEEIAQMGYWEWDPIKDKFVWSDNLYRIFGLEIGTEMSLELLVSRVHPDDKEHVQQVTLDLFETKKFKKFTYRIIPPNDNIKTLEVLGQVECNEDGDIVKLIGVTQDITIRAQKEQELNKNNKLLNLASKIAQVGYWQWKLDNNEIIWSNNLYQLFEVEPELAITKDLLLSLIHPDDRELLQNAMEETIKQKQFKKIRHRRIANNGSIRTFEITGEFIYNEKGEAIELIGTTQDITEIIQKESKLLKANEHLEQVTQKLTARNKQLAEFNHITSHNLRSPVSNLNALLGMHKDPTYEHLKEELFQKFEIVVDHLTLTLNTLVESLKVKHEANKSIQQLSFDETLNKTKEILAAEIIKTNANIKCNFTDVPKIVYNQIYLESIFLNLLGNAMKYKSQDRTPEIEIESRELNGRVQLSFKDNGMGIDLKQHGDKLFGLNKVFHRHPDAKGVGLFLTKAQVEAMGGSISAESKVNEGSTFTVTLN